MSSVEASYLVQDSAVFDTAVANAIAKSHGHLGPNLRTSHFLLSSNAVRALVGLVAEFKSLLPKAYMGSVIPEALACGAAILNHYAHDFKGGKKELDQESHLINQYLSAFCRNYVSGGQIQMFTHDGEALRWFRQAHPTTIAALKEGPSIFESRHLNDLQKLSSICSTNIDLPQNKWEYTPSIPHKTSTLSAQRPPGPDDYPVIWAALEEDLHQLANWSALVLQFTNLTSWAP